MSNYSISEVAVVPVKPQDGLVAFASFVLDGSLYLGSVGIFTRPHGGYRLVYPTKQVAGRQLNLFHPITGGLGQHIEDVVTAKYEEVVNHGRNRHRDIDPEQQ